MEVKVNWAEVGTNWAEVGTERAEVDTERAEVGTNWAEVGTNWVDIVINPTTQNIYIISDEPDPKAGGMYVYIISPNKCNQPQQMVLWHKIQSILFDYASYLSYFLYIFTALGISSRAPTYLDVVLYYIQLYVGVFLLWRFSPLRRRIHMNELDVKIAFNGGVILVLSSFMSALNTRYSAYLDRLKTSAKSTLAIADNPKYSDDSDPSVK